MTFQQNLLEVCVGGLKSFRTHICLILAFGEMYLTISETF